MATARILVEGCQDRITIISGKVQFEFAAEKGLWTIALGDRGHLLKNAAIAFRSQSRVIDSSSYPEVSWRVADFSDNLGDKG